MWKHVKKMLWSRRISSNLCFVQLWRGSLRRALQGISVFRGCLPVKGSGESLGFNGARHHSSWCTVLRTGRLARQSGPHFASFCLEWCCMILYSNVRSIQTYFGLAAWLSPVVWRCVICSKFREQWVEGVVLWACILVATFELRLWPGSSSAFSPVLLLMWRWRSMNRFAKIWFEACHLWTCHMAHWSLCTARLSACIPHTSAVPTLHWRPWTSFRRWSFLTDRGGIPHETVVTSIFLDIFSWCCKLCVSVMLQSVADDDLNSNTSVEFLEP